MEVVLLGTGGADGVPQPFCDCPGCAHARTHGEVRASGGALINRHLLIDAPPALGAAAARAGVDLRNVDTIAVTHAHHDHWDPAVLLHHAWQFPERPLRIIGPPLVLAQAAQWLPPRRGDDLVEAVPGVPIRTGTLTLRPLPSTHGRDSADAVAAEGMLYDVDDGSRRMLYAADTGIPDEPMLEALAGRDFHLVLLELTFGAEGPSTPGHLDHTSFPITLAQLREIGAIGGRTDIVAIHIGHHNPPTPQLAASLRRWGARCVPDGTRLRPGDRQPARLTLVTGGARSGKSAYAEFRAQQTGTTVTYIATGWGEGDDDSWNARIAAHRARRPADWISEENADLPTALRHVPTGSTVIVDCVATWLTRVVDDSQSWGDALRAADTVAAATAKLTEALAATEAAEVFVVTNEVGSGVVPATPVGGLFRDLLGRTNTRLAAAADDVVLLVAGRALHLGGGATHD